MINKLTIYPPGVYYSSMDDKNYNNECCCIRYKNIPRSQLSQKDLENRLNRMAGQLNGIKSMLQDNRYCGDILMQVSALESALQNFGYIILQNHLETCVVEEIQKGNTDILEETIALIKRLK